jgi:ferredoxin-NADP reductase
MFSEQGHITRDILDRHCRPTESAIYLCGPPGMQDSVIEELRALGVNPDRVDTEAFVYRSQS